MNNTALRTTRRLVVRTALRRNHPRQEPIWKGQQRCAQSTLSSEQGQGGSSDASHVWFAGAVAAASPLIAHCNETATCESLASKDNDADDLPPNPLWPSGVPQEMVDTFVDEILADPSINIAAIPDSIEREIYVNTVLLTLNCVYESVGGFHGMEMFGHVIELHRIDDDEHDIESDNASSNTASQSAQVSGTEKTMKQRVRRAYSRNAYGPGSIDHAALEAVADRLLANKAVNQPLIPDVVERQLYINCLKLVFRLLDAVASTLRITVCGHDVRMIFEPCSDQSTRDWIKDRLQKRMGDASSRLTEVDLAAVEKYARQVGAAPEGQDHMSWIGRFWRGGQREMEVQLNKTLYALILGIIDDLLEDTVLTFLTDRVRMDVVARPGKGGNEENVGAKRKGEEGTGGKGTKLHDGPGRKDATAASTALPVGAFAIGVGVGAALMSAAVAGGGRR